jgi:molecular chaperone GrpE
MKVKQNTDKKVNGDLETVKGQLARALADYDNLKKRTEAEKAVWLKFAKEQLLVKLLPAIDSLMLAQSHLKDKGLEISIGEFKNIVKEEGIEEITETKVFDENLHEAVELVPGGTKGEISEVIQTGYKFLDGTVVRPAKVIVFSGKK